MKRRELLAALGGLGGGLGGDRYQRWRFWLGL
mgnify:CR=1 FL=1